ncbi:hypothetical protein N8D56_09630 [Devosia sp. A8/3-2]|nr:hypothetical protein N8D56_09630 [Devosia sp. A8/3-2]
MGKLTYGMIMSLDGFVADASDYFDDEILGFINDETRKYGTEIYGRRMYEEMVYWETYRVEQGVTGFADRICPYLEGVRQAGHLFDSLSGPRVTKRGSCASSSRAKSAGSRRKPSRTFRSPVRRWPRNSSRQDW